VTLCAEAAAVSNFLDKMTARAGSGAAAFNVHQETVVACLLIGLTGARPSKEGGTFGTMTRDLEALRDWLAAVGVTHGGKHRRLLAAGLCGPEGHFDLIVGNVRHIRNGPGRKTDVKDADWIADLVRHGLIAKSFVPPAPLRDLRELLRRRRMRRPRRWLPWPRDKRAELVLALDGKKEHHRFLLAMQLRRLEAAEQDVAALDLRIADRA
jgi:hypothetical protein